jgi:hypothetical protein
MSYILHFSDITSNATIVVTSTDEGTGLNNYSTSLDLVGSGYTNYGLPTAQNFLKLLENFAGPTPPIHPIKCQLWYDTTGTNARPVLRINNGSSTVARWPSANGIYQQSVDPADPDPNVSVYSSIIVDGDIWVDTVNNQLKIRYDSGWTTVGPNIETGPNKSGSETISVESITGTSYPIIKNWVNGKVVEIISYDSFTPRSVIDGFTTIKAGVNITSKISTKYYGSSEKASALEITPGVLLEPDQVYTQSDFSTDVNPYLFKPGMIISFGNSTSVPSGFLKCDNHSVSVASYPDLYSVIGTTYGTSGSGTFRTPNMSTSTYIAGVGYLTYIIKT